MTDYEEIRCQQCGSLMYLTADEAETTLYCCQRCEVLAEEDDEDEE